MKRHLRAVGGLIALGVLGFLVAGVVASTATGTHPTTTTTTGGGHTPVTICHKPGTPAEQELTVDDDSVELTGHLGHGDTIGPCPTQSTTTETTTTGTTTTEPTETQPTETEPTEPTTTSTVPNDCPPGMIHGRGHDGNEGNDDCCFPGVNCDGDTPQTTDGTTTGETTTGTTPTTPEPTTGQETTEPEPESTVTPDAPVVTVKPKPKPPKKHAKPKPPARVCSPGAVETAPCGVQGSG